MWKANKTGILTLVFGLAGLGAAYAWLKPQDELLAQQTLAVGICALLFAVAMGTWLSVRRDLVRCRKAAAQADDAQQDDETQDAP